MNSALEKICVVGAEDAAALASLDASASDYPWRETQFLSALNQGAFALALEEAEQLSGFILCSIMFDEATILNVAVHPHFQRQGRAQRLLQLALGQMREQGCKRCLLEVRESNEAARRMYEHAGFTVDGVRKSYYPGGDGREDAILMSRPVEGSE